MNRNRQILIDAGLVTLAQRSKGKYRFPLSYGRVGHAHKVAGGRISWVATIRTAIHGQLVADCGTFPTLRRAVQVLFYKDGQIEGLAMNPTEAVEREAKAEGKERAE